MLGEEHKKEELQLFYLMNPSALFVAFNEMN
jgi:hypothetical protein